MADTRIQNPGLPPRRIGLGELYNHLPAFLQMGVIFTPLAAIAGGIWYAVEPCKDSFVAMGTGAWALPLMWIWALVYWKRFKKYQAVEAQITGFTRATGGMMFAKIVSYRYKIGDASFDGEQMVIDTKGLVAGQTIWVLINPKVPGKSIAWLGLR